MLRLSDVGVDVLRLDAVPFLWKREGTDCENLPEVHVLLRTLRAVMAVASPATIFKAEAIVPPDQLTPYLGAGDPPQRECELAYHNQLMVLLWSSLATGDAQLMANSLRRVGSIPSHASWVTYVRCHDDIGWAITDEAAASMGWDGFAHRHFLNEFYAGEFPGSFARGAVFQFNPETGDGRISGSAASLCGIETALDSGNAVGPRSRVPTARSGLRDGRPRSVVCRCSTWVTRSGCATMLSYLDDPALADDNRWMHRPTMDWSVAARRSDATTLEGRLFAMFQSLLADRAATPALHGGAGVEVLTTPSPSLFGFVRHHPVAGRFSMLANFGRQAVVTDLAALGLDGWHVVRSSGVEVRSARVTMASDGIRVADHDRLNHEEHGTETGQ